MFAGSVSSGIGDIRTSISPTVYAFETEVIPEAPIVEEKKPNTNTEECNCWLFIKRRMPWLPDQTKNIIPNSDYPIVGGVTMLEYGEKKHYVENTKVVKEGVWIKESNFGKCGYSERLLTWAYLKEHNAKYIHAPE